MDVILRARHDQLVQEFLCSATELRLLHTPAGSRWTRTIDPFCGDERAVRFGSRLADFATCCAACRFFTLKDGAVDAAEPAEEESETLRQPA